jgi:hypothetical protein
MKTRIKYYFFLLGLSFMISSCSDILETDPKGQLAQSTFFSTEDDLSMAVTAVFRLLQEQNLHTGFPIAQEGDDITAHPASNKVMYREFDQYNVSATNANQAWSRNYQLIKAANFVINNAAKTPTDKAKISQAIAVAKVWRAYAYFVLVRTYGNIPVMLDVEINYEKTLTSVADVYALIISDLKDAEVALPNKWTTSPMLKNGENIYPTAGAAKGLLAEVYLAMAGWPLKQSGAYALARDKAKEVIDGVKNGTYSYALHQTFADVTASRYNYSSENLLAVHYANIDGETSNSAIMTILESAGGYGVMFGEIKFWKNMPDNLRKASIYAPKVALNSGLVNWWETPEKHPMLIVYAEAPAITAEYNYKTDNSRIPGGYKTHRILCYSDILLCYAEAQARADGTPNALAYECINLIRNRADGAGPITGVQPGKVIPGVVVNYDPPKDYVCRGDLQSGLSGPAFAAEVVAEHGWEVAGNVFSVACRFFDMQRLEMVKAHYEQRKINQTIEVAPGISLNEPIPVTRASWDDNTMYSVQPANDVPFIKK